jgi:hypothetical protein
MSTTDVIWLLWLVVFLFFEIRAVRSKAPGDTFSEFVWRLTKHNAARFTMLGFLIWLALHLVGGQGHF